MKKCQELEILNELYVCEFLFPYSAGPRRHRRHFREVRQVTSLEKQIVSLGLGNFNSSWSLRKRTVHSGEKKANYSLQHSIMGSVLQTARLTHESLLSQKN